MRVKKFLAENYAEALERVKQELGEEALILSTRSIKFHPDEEEGNTSSCVEITAALEREPVVEPEKSSPPLVKNTEELPINLPTNGWEQIQPLIQSLMTETDRARSAGLNLGQMEFFGHLIRQGVDDEVAVRMFRWINSNRDQYGVVDGESEKKALIQLMKGILKCPGPVELAKGKPKIVALVGPTGSGKTTTVAKLAAQYSLVHNKKVAIVSLDTFRVGAVEQLRAYGELMDVPVESAQGRLDFRKTISKHRDKDLILVDTTGKSHRDTDYALELAAIFNSVGEVEVHLVANVTAQDIVLNQTVSQFSILKPQRVLFTKLDEGVTFGHLFNFAVRHRIPFSYFTAGQRVPEDIETAARERVIHLIFD